MDYWASAFLQKGVEFCWACDALPAFGAEAIPKILDAVNSPDRRLREYHFPSIVGEIAKASPQVVDQLLQASTMNPLIADICISYLACNSERAVDYLARVATESTCPESRVDAIADASHCCDLADFVQRPGVSNAIVAVITDSVRDLKAGRSEDFDEIEAACPFIAVLPRNDDEKVDLCELILSVRVSGRRCPPCFVSTVLEQLGEIGSPRAIARLFAWAADESASYRRKAIGALRWMDPPPVSQAIMLTEPEHGPLRVAAFWLLAEVDGLNEAALRHCENWLEDAWTNVLMRRFEDGPEDSTPQACIAAAVALARHKRLTPAALDVLALAVRSPKRAYRRAAINGLWRVPQRIEIVDCVIPNLLRDAHDEICTSAMSRVTDVRLDSPAIRTELVRIAERHIEFDSYHDSLVAEALVSTRCRQVVPIIVESLKEQCPERRERAVRLLGEIGPMAGSAVGALVDYWYVCDPDSRHVILDAIHQIGPTGSAVPLIEVGLDAASDAVSDYLLFSAAAHCAEEIGKQYASRIVPRLLAALTGQDRGRQRAAARALSHCGNKWVAEAARLVRSANPVVRAGAVTALGHCKPPIPKAAFDGVTLALKDGDLAVKLAALESIPWSGKEFRPIEPAVRAMCNDPRDSVRYQACQVIQAWNESATTRRLR